MRLRYRHKSLAWILIVLLLFVIGTALQGRAGTGGILTLLALCFVCELVDSGLGMGYGTILTPVLLFMGYQPHDIVPTVLLSELLSGFAASFFHNEIRNVHLGRGGVDLKPAVLLAGGSVVGVSIGVLTAVNIQARALKLVIGVIILVSGLTVTLLARRAIRYRSWRMLLLAGVASFNKAASGGGYGPLVTSGQILSGVRTQASVGITSFAEAFTCLLAVALFLIKGGFINMAIFVPMATGALLSVPFAVFAINRAREVRLKAVIGAVTTVMGAVTIAKAL